MQCFSIPLWYTGFSNLSAILSEQCIASPLSQNDFKIGNLATAILIYLYDLYRFVPAVSRSPLEISPTTQNLIKFDLKFLSYWWNVARLPQMLCFSSWRDHIKCGRLKNSFIAFDLKICSSCRVVWKTICFNLNSNI